MVETLDKLLGVVDDVIVDVFVGVLFRVVALFAEELGKRLNEPQHVFRDLSEWLEGIDDLSDSLARPV